MPNHETLPLDGNLLRLVAEQAREHAFIIIDPDGRIRWCNPGTERIFGAPVGDFIGEHVSVLFTPEDIADGMADFEMATARAHGSAEDDRWLARRDGSTFWASGVMSAVRNERGEIVGFGKILRNRTDLWERLEELRNQVSALEQSSRRKDEFIATLSHELRNPLAPLSNAAQLMRMSAEITPELDQPLGVIERQIEALRKLVDDMLDLSRIGAGKVELRKETIQLNEIIHRALQSVGPLIRERRHEINVLLPPTAIVIEADPARLEQVFVNLLNNAAKFTPEGGLIWIRATTEGHAAVVHVEDTGVGIPHDMLPRIFDLFTQVESSRDQSQSGLGIGLSLVKNLVTLHGGSVQVRSYGKGQGSVFTVRLPLRSAAPARA